MVNQALKGRAVALAKSTAYAEDAVVSKTLLNKKAGTLTVFAFDAGQSLSEIIVESPLIPPRLNPERQQDRAYDHHAFHEDAEPGDLRLQLGTRRFSSSKKFSTTMIWLATSSATKARAIRNRSSSEVMS